MAKQDRLWLPLSAPAYQDFTEFGKVYEIRVCVGQYSEKFVYPDRRVELSNGYGKQNRRWGTIGRVVTGSLEEIFEKVEHRLVEPRADSVDKAIAENKDLLGEHPKYIAFEIRLDE